MSTQDYSPNKPGKAADQHRARGYQLEMLDESLKKNIIVTMDTGSGKTYMYVISTVSHENLPADHLTQQYPGSKSILIRTHRAVLRIMAELDRCAPEKIVWFLAPTVTLCTQQHEVISLQLPAVRTRLLIGSDNVDRWSELRIWDAALKDVQVVVSTHAVLADALGHGFVRISKLALLVFDEAHHCTRKHPANKIMRDFYHPTKTQLGPCAVPHILGLTASPIVRSKPSELRTIEANLDSISRTPRLQRREMLQYVHRPLLRRLDYRPLDANVHVNGSCVLQNLISVCKMTYIRHDPLVPRLNAGIDSHSRLAYVYSTRKTPGEQLRKFSQKAKHIYEELGPWAADYFILESIARLKKAVEPKKETYLGLEDYGQGYLIEELSKIPIMGLRNFFAGDSPQISPKLERLISFLVAEDQPEFSGLIFVRQRATVSVMYEILSVHPDTKDRFHCAPYVGWSNSASRKQNIGELLDVRAQRETLTDFRNGRKNLIIATDVLEEGIDITACHLVICYDSPPNLKSFVQRRGRARQKQSTFVIMLAEGDMAGTFDSWQQLEEEMVRAYQDDARRLQEALKLESISEEVTDRFEVASTGAVMTADWAVAHLYHFCAVLPPQPYVDLRPAFSFRDRTGTGLIIGEVTLPNCVNSSVRHARGRKSWRSEHAAMKDAAFQAYIALYRAGLLNDHLLPLTPERMSEEDGQKEVPSTVEISGQFSPWANLAKVWATPDLHQTVVIIEQDKGNRDMLSMFLTTSMAIPSVRPFPLYWDDKTTFTIRLGTPHQYNAANPDYLRLMREITHTILRSTHSDHKLDDRKDFVALFAPEINEDKLVTWFAANRGRQPAQEEFHLDHGISGRGLVRNTLLGGIPYIFNRWRISSSDEAEEEVGVECLSLPKRRNFLHRSTLSTRPIDTLDRDEGGSSGARLFPVKTCTVDRLPFEQARLSLFIPAILQHVEVLMVANELCKTAIKDVPFSDPYHVIEAISASSAQWITNYQRYEFLGDSILKFVVSSQLFLDHVNWHEGYLSERRASLVSNYRLARAALDVGLDQFIMTESFISRGWVPPFISELETSTAGRRRVSGKILADVVEALIGAAFMDGGLFAAKTCIQTFLPEICTQTTTFRSIDDQHSLDHATNQTIKRKAELLIDYQFHNKHLLTEALTHPSCERDALTESYQRLEFLGDAVLDMVVVSALFESKPDLSHGDMTLIKAALVNADLLGFLCMELSVEQDAVTIEQKSNGAFSEVHVKDRIELWEVMRHHSHDIMRAQQACLERRRQLRHDVRRCLDQGRSHPWAQLAQLNLEKYYSDLVESIFGAIFVDSECNLADCRRFAERIGILPYLQRLVAEHIDVAHPKTTLDRMTGSSKVEYIVGHEENGPGLYRCQVRISNDADVIAVGRCLSKDEAVTRAADAAVKEMLLRKKIAQVDLNDI